jgi:hypothetical protein
MVTRFLVALCCVLLALSVSASSKGARELYRPELGKELTQEQRWSTDVELANEIQIMDMNSRRFLDGNPFEQRARWVENLATSYKVADLVQQLVDFRRSTMRPNERAFMELVQRARTGDIGATCLAPVLYSRFPKKVVQSWPITYSRLVGDAMNAKDSGHPVCANVAASVYLLGTAGYPKDAQRAKQWIVASAVAGSYRYRMRLANSHLAGAAALDKSEVALRLCWLRVADQIAPHAAFRYACEMYRDGRTIGPDLRTVDVGPDVQEVAHAWCQPSRSVTAQVCADLEKSR